MVYGFRDSDKPLESQDGWPRGEASRPIKSLQKKKRQSKPYQGVFRLGVMKDAS